MGEALLSGDMSNGKQRKAAEVYPFLETYIEKKQKQIADIVQVVERYERKRITEERAYQALSPIRRMLTGKRPDHHLAVEYIHYVKQPMERVKRLQNEVERAQAIIRDTQPTDLVVLPVDMEDELT